MEKIRGLDDYRQLPDGNRRAFLGSVLDGSEYPLGIVDRVLICGLSADTDRHIAHGHDLVIAHWDKKEKGKQEVKVKKTKRTGTQPNGFTVRLSAHTVRDGGLTRIRPASLMVLVYLMSCVWRSKHTSDPINKYLHDAFYANGSLAAYQSVRTISEATNLSGTTVSSAIKDLVENKMMEKRLMPKHLNNQGGIAVPRYAYKLGYVGKKQEVWFFDLVDGEEDDLNGDN